MKTAGIAELKAHLTAWIRRAKAGEEVIVTERGVPVAKLVPIEPAERGSRRERLAAAGVLKLGTGKLPAWFFEDPLPRSNASVLEALLDERKENR